MKIQIIILTALLTVVSYAKQKTNIILILADDMGYECLGANGCEEYKTPNIDKLAKGGVRFTQCFANPKCTQSRVKLMTGKYNARNFTKFGELDRSQSTFAQALKKAGYKTAIAGKWQLGSELDAPQHFGFDQACLWQHTRGRHRAEPHKGQDSRYPNPQLEINGVEKNYTHGEYGPDICNRFLCHFIEENKDEPFLVYYPMILPHWPWIATPDSKGWDPNNFGPTENKPGSLKEQHLYFGDMVRYADKLVGNIIQTVEQNGLRDNTLVIFLGDNGTDIPIITQWNGQNIAGAKGHVKDEGTRVPCVLNWPKQLKPKRYTTELVEFTDFLPTICELSGASLPQDYPNDGVSLWPLLTQSAKREKPYVFMTYNGTAWARNIDYAVRLPKQSKQYEYQKYTGHYAMYPLSMADANHAERQVFTQLQSVIESFKK